MLAAAKSIAGDGALGVVLGLGVALTFGGVLLRAVAARLSGSRAAAPVRARPEATARPSAGRLVSSNRPPPNRLEDPVRGLAAIADACEPESRRLPDDCLAPLARTLEGSRRLLAAEERAAAALAGLPVGFWLVERNVLVGARRIPLLALGATGVFAICPTDGAWTIDDLGVMSDLAERVRRQLPDAAGPVHAAVCLAFDDLKPRTWFGGEAQRGRGAWLLGLDWLLPWMFSFGPEQGLRNGDLRRLDETAGPTWERCRTARLPAVRRLG
jgi:hypothetical protein